MVDSDILQISVHRFRDGYEASLQHGVQPQNLLFTTPNRLRLGQSDETPARSFLGRPVERGDSIAFVPYPQGNITAGAVVADTAGLRRAGQRSRRVFRDVVGAWAAALPRNAGTKEAVAVSLELEGDLKAALDSVRAARRLASDSSLALRLAVTQVLLSVKLGLGEDTNQLVPAVQLADSILTASGGFDATGAESLTRIATLTGRCRRASALMRSAATSIPTAVVIPPGVLATAYALVPPVALGCTSSAELPNLTAQLAPGGTKASDRAMAEYHIFGALAGLAFQDNPGLVRRLAATSGDFVLVAEDSLMRRDTTAARRVLRSTLGSSRGALPTDAALTEARLWLALRDTITAITVMEHSLAGFPLSAPMSTENTLQNALRMASLSRLLALRADVASARGETASRWARPLTVLWNNADPELKPVTDRMKRLSSR